MNPLTINSANVVQFGFSSLFNLLTKKLFVNVAELTVFETGGAANIVSINIDVTDATGMKLGPYTVNTGTLAPIEVPLGNRFVFGFYTIKATLIDQDGKTYIVEVTPQEICQPEGWDGKQAKGKFNVKTNCSSATATIYDETSFAYKKLSPIAKEYNGKLFYPDNILNELSFEFTPFQVGGAEGLYSGTYRVNNTTLATYDLDDNLTIVIPFVTVDEHSVDCSNSVAQLMCCIDDVQTVAQSSPTSIKGIAAKAKIAEILPELMLAIVKDNNGKDASGEVKNIRKILDCSCGCGSSDLLQPSIIGGPGSNISISGSGATTVDENSAGSSTEYVIHSKAYSVVKSTSSDPGFSITKTENANNVTFALAFNYTALSTVILNTIKGDQALINLFNEIIGNTSSAVVQGLNGRCIIDFTCDYVLSESAANRIVTSVLIDGTVYNAPGSLALSNANAVLSWLNGLDKGVFTGGYNSGTLKTTISSVDNENIIYQLNITTSGTAGIIAFTRSCTDLQDVLQALIDYICDLTTSQVKLSAALVLATKPAGTIVNQNFALGSPLHTYLAALNTQFTNFLTNYLPPTNGTNGTNGRSVKVFTQPTQPTSGQGPFENGDIWIVE